MACSALATILRFFGLEHLRSIFSLSLSSLSSPAQQVAALRDSDCQQFRSYSSSSFCSLFFFGTHFVLFVSCFCFFFCVSGFTKIFTMLNFQKTRSPMASPPLIWVPSWRWLKRPELPPCCVLPAETRTRRSPGSRTCFLWTSAAVTGALNSFAQVQFDLITFQTLWFDQIKMSFRCFWSSKYNKYKLQGHEDDVKNIKNEWLHGFLFHHKSH